MDTLAQSLLGTRGLSALWLLLLLSPAILASYSIGVGRADSTGPTADIVFMGYAKMEQKGNGLHLRTFARAFIIDDGTERFVFVSVDNAMIGNDIRQEVLRKLKIQFGDMYTENNVMISGTHTHSAPGGFMLDMLFDLTTFGFIRESFDAVVNGITNSIQRAHNAVVPGRIFIIHGKVLDANINRSPQAYLNNPKSEREKYKYDVDKTLTQMQFIGADDKPLGVINWFAVHPTSMNNTNRLVSSDNVGYASILFEKMMNSNAMVGKGRFVAAFASTNLGDVSPNIRGPKCEFSGQNCSDQYTCPGKKEMCFASGPGKDMFDSTSIIAHRIYEESMPYSPDIAPSNFHLFRSMAHGLADRRFHSYEEAQKWIDSWIASKDMSFFRRGIHVLPERWEKVVNSDGQYFKSNVCFPYILNTSFYFVKKQRELIQGPNKCQNLQ
ncbi:NCASE ceramidase, partial [Pseudoatta argentina]